MTWNGRDSRGQTTQDFAVGISLFLLAITFVFTFVPGLIDASASGAETQEQLTADRTAESIVSNLSVVGEPNTLDRTATDRLFATDADALEDRFGYDYQDLNVTIRTMSGDAIVTNATGEPYAAGEAYHGQSASVSVRVVKLTGPNCSTGCKLVVRVW
jgi:hypothetical protein